MRHEVQFDQELTFFFAQTLRESIPTAQLRSQSATAILRASPIAYKLAPFRSI